MKLVVASLSIAAAMAAASAAAAQTGGPNLLQGVKAQKSPTPLGQPVEFVYAIRNRGSQPVTYTFSSAKQFDVWVKLGDKEIFRHSKGRVYATAITRLTLRPGETKTFAARWDQRDEKGNQVGPGVYTVFAQLTPVKDAPPATSAKFELGGAGAALIPLTVREAISRAPSLKDKKVAIAALYRGLQPDPKDPNTKPGPPATKDDWVICDHTGCMFVTGAVQLDPEKDAGARITVTGLVRTTPKGQVYLVLDRATVEKEVSGR